MSFSPNIIPYPPPAGTRDRPSGAAETAIIRAPPRICRFILIKKRLSARPGLGAARADKRFA